MVVKIQRSIACERLVAIAGYTFLVCSRPKGKIISGKDPLEACAGTGWHSEELSYFLFSFLPMMGFMNCFNCNPVPPWNKDHSHRRFETAARFG
jgi:hypothetical protein